MTSAFLLARAGHRVTLFEAGGEIGGLWSSQLDADGFFRGDNSCKVYQSGYHTAPALFVLIGTDWTAHFTPRHDLTTDWLRPFCRESSWRDLAWIAGAWAQHRVGLGRFHELSVAEFMDRHAFTEPCRAWMRATALGGVAGTMRMTMWELFHRIGSNLTEIFRGAAGPLYWNQRPPNAAGGFVSFWKEALVRLGVELRPGTAISRLALGAPGNSVRLHDATGASHDADAVFLALPPPALGRLLAASEEPLARGFGRSGTELQEFLRTSMYSHVGISWFFDRPLPADLPLGGHNVRRGWHPILVQHAQYQPHLRPPAESVVVGSVAVDTELRHHRLGTLAREHSAEELAAILWADERERDPRLPEPIEFVVAGPSAATQIVRHGPLPLRMDTAPVFLATNLHGLAPYFTASLESAIQAGAIAAEAYDPAVERLPMGVSAATRLPWGPREAGPRPSDGGQSALLASHAPR